MSGKGAGSPHERAMIEQGSHGGWSKSVEAGIAELVQAFFTQFVAHATHLEATKGTCIQIVGAPATGQHLCPLCLAFAAIGFPNSQD